MRHHRLEDPARPAGSPYSPGNRRRRAQTRQRTAAQVRRTSHHTLFDHGYLGVDPGYRLHVSPRLRGEFGNGEQFYERAGHPVALPTRWAGRPGGEFLEWHLDTIFKAS